MTERPAPSATGSFDKTPLSHVLVYVYDRKLSGSVEIRSQNRTDEIYFKQGFPARARIGEPADPLGRVLLEMGLIDEHAFTTSLMKLGGGEGLQGRILIQQGALDLPGLVRGLREQLRRKLVKLFTVRQATYAYFDGTNLLERYGGEENIRIDPLPIVLAGVRYAYEDERLQPVLQRVAGQQLRVTSGSGLADRFELGPDDRKLLSFIEAAPRSLDAIAKQAVSPRAASTLCYCLVLTHQVEVVRSAGAPAGAADGRIAESPAGVRTPPYVPAARPPEQRAPSPAPARAVTPPDGVAGARPASAPRLPGSGRRPSRPDVPAMPSDAPPEVLATREEILERASVLDNQDYFLMLGATHEDGEEALRRKYFELAKKYHPDRVMTGLEDLRETLDYIFANLTEAYTTLTEVDKRRRYLELMRDGSGTMADQRKIQGILDAAMSLQKAEVCLRRKNYEEAERYCRIAIDGNSDDGEPLALLGWIQLHRREIGLPLNDILELLKKALALSPASEKANFYLATALKRSGEGAAALTYFRKAASINPRNLDALREVRLHEMRRERRTSVPPDAPQGGKPKPKGGLFDKLFGKK